MLDFIGLFVATALALATMVAVCFGLAYLCKWMIDSFEYGVYMAGATLFLSATFVVSVTEFLKER